MELKMIQMDIIKHGEQLLTVKEVASMLGIGKSTVWELTRSGKIPKPIKISMKITRWRRSDFSHMIYG